MADTADLQSQQQAQLKQENYQSEEEEENTNNADEEEDPVDDLTESAWILKLRGLPWSVTTQDILNFLDGVEVVGGTNGVHLITFSLNSTRPNGEAFVVCANEESFNKAFEYNKHTIGHRYIEIFSSSFEDFQNIMHKQTIDQQDTVVKLRGLPWRVTEQEIADFFQGMELSDEYGIHIHMDRSGRASGEAFVQFKTAESCEKALKRNLEKIGHRYIEIFRSTTSEIRRSMQQSNDNNYNNGGGGGGNNNNGGGNTNYGGGNNNRATPYDRNNRGDRGSGFNRMGGNNNMGNNNGGGNGMGYNNRGNNMRGVGERSYSSTGSNNSWNNDGNNGGNNGGNNFGNNSYGGGGNNNGGGFNNFGNNGGMNGGNNGGFNPGGFGGNNFGNSGGGFGNNFSGGFMGGNSNQSPLNFGFGSGGNGNMGSSNSVLSGVGSGFGGGNNYGTGNNGGNNSLGGGGNNGSGSGSGYGAMNMLGFGGIGGGGVGTPAFSSPNSTGIQFGQNNSGGNNNARNNYGSGYSSNSNGATSNNLQQQSGSMPPVNNTAGNVGNNMSGPSSNSGNEQFCVHLRGMPYYCDEMDIIKFFAPLKPVNCKVIYNNKNMHSGGGNAYFATHADAMEAMKHDKEKMGSRYIELFYDTPNRQNNRRY